MSCLGYFNDNTFVICVSSTGVNFVEMAFHTGYLLTYSKMLHLPLLTRNIGPVSYTHLTLPTTPYV